MRLLIVSNFVAFPQQPQADIFIRQRAAALRRLGAEVTVVPLYPVPRPRLPRLPRAGDVDWAGKECPTDAATSALPVSGIVFGAAVAGGAAAACRSMARQLAGRLKSGDFDLVIGHGSYRFPAAGVARHLAVAWRRPYVAAAHGSDITAMRASGRRFQKVIFAEAAGTTFVSEALLRETRRIGIHPANPRVIRNGADRAVFGLTQAQPQPPLRLLFAGSLTEVKGADRLPSILHAVRRFRPDAQLTVAGAGPLRGPLSRQLPDARFSGEVSQAELAKLMGSSHVLVVPSRSEGFGCVVVEALSTGTVVVATDVGGLSEAVGAGGVLVPGSPGFDARRFAVAVVQAAGRDRSQVAAAAGPDWDDVARQELAFFQSLGGA